MPRLRPIWVVVLLALGALVVLNRMSVQTLRAADDLSLSQRKALFVRMDSLEKRVRMIERRLP